MKIIIAPYNPEWSIQFQKEKALLETVLAGKKARIEHIGSTSVENLDAKPIIDIMIGIPDFSLVDACIEPVRSLGYEYPPDYQNFFPKRRYFRKWLNSETRSHHIHLTEIDCQFWKRHLFFRNYLRSHPKTRQAYEDLKHNLAKREWEEMDSYAKAKTEFIQSIEAKMPQ